MKTIAMTGIAVLSILTTGTGVTQVNEAFAELSQGIEMARTIAATDRKMLTMQEMQLTPQEAEAFWPLYDEYQQDIKKAHDLRIKVITDYAAAYPDVSNEQASKLLADSLKHDKKVTKTKKKYLRRFKRILPATKVMRFYQLDNKLDAILNFKLAANIPLIEGKENAPN